MQGRDSGRKLKNMNVTKADYMLSIITGLDRGYNNFK